MSVEAAVVTGALAGIVQSFLRRALDSNRPAVEGVLAAHSLSIKQIESQDLDELNKSLAALDVLIDDPKSLGTYPAFPAEGETTLAVGGAKRITFNPLPILLERRATILQRIARLEQQQNLDSIVSAATDEDIPREPAAETVQRLALASKERQKELSGEIAKTEQQYQQSLQELLLVEEHKMTIRERVAVVRQSYVRRDVVAGAAGLLLLLIFGVTVVVAMFTHTTVVPIISDSFLLILGYFFGQATKADKADT
jgi:hypothetical protein